MPSAQLRCHGCDKVFTPRGLSQHVNKTHDSRCRVNVASQGRSVSASVVCTAFQPGLYPNHTSQDLGGNGPGGQYDRESGEASNETPDLNTLSSDGMFAVLPPFFF